MPAWLSSANAADSATATSTRARFARCSYGCARTSVSGVTNWRTCGWCWMRRIMGQALTIRVEEFLPHPVAKVWRALTDAELLARWLMLNDFKLELGHRFTFQTAPLPAVGLDGVIHCEVLTIEPLHLLWLSWRGGRGLDSILTWRLEPENAGTRLIVE